MALDQIIGILETSGYLLLFPLAVMEGPIITVISGFLVSLGIFNVFIAYSIIVIGDILGDAFWYLLGRHGSGWKYTRPIEKFFGLTPERIESTRERFRTHRYKMMMASKFIHGVGSAGLVAAGMVRVPYLTFATTCLTVTMIQAALFLALGYFFGQAYGQIGQYLDYFAAAGLVIGCVGIALGIWYVRRNKQS
ncbi:MAG: hypothetical protein JWL87_697 [Candidatus Adlerbacteria bacterium]|nr:hypothetical protein [Candidatus Adlerbacteria bacterium]